MSSTSTVWLKEWIYLGKTLYNMIHEKLKIGRWNVDFLFAPNGYDTEEALTYLYYADASEHIMQKAYHILEDNEMNTGFAFTNQDMREAVVVVGPAESGSEFLDTLAHEVHHVAVAIAESIGVDLAGETPAYIAGDSIRELAKVICDLGCERCQG